jgi:hypothetical protein
MEIGKCQAYIVDNCLKSQKKKELMLCLLVICRSSLLPDVGLPVYGNPVKVLPTEDFLSLRILVDQFIVESFVQGGRVVITSRVYPTVATHNLAKLYLFNNGTTPITVRKITTWHMSEVIMRPY